MLPGGSSWFQQRTLWTVWHSNSFVLFACVRCVRRVRLYSDAFECVRVCMRAHECVEQPPPPPSVYVLCTVCCVLRAVCCTHRTRCLIELRSPSSAARKNWNWRDMGRTARSLVRLEDATVSSRAIPWFCVSRARKMADLPGGRVFTAGVYRVFGEWWECSV